MSVVSCAVAKSSAKLKRATALRRFLAEYEREHGAFSADELELAELSMHLRKVDLSGGRPRRKSDDKILVLAYSALAELLRSSLGAHRTHLRHMKKKRSAPETNTAPARQLWAMKRASQKRDRKLVANKTVAPETLHFLRGDRMRGFRIDWPDTPMRDVDSHRANAKASPKREKRHR